jgi:hypothetical protein
LRLNMSSKCDQYRCEKTRNIWRKMVWHVSMKFWGNPLRLPTQSCPDSATGVQKAGLSA